MSDDRFSAVQFDCDGDLSRSWFVVKEVGRREVQIQNAKTGKCLTIAGGTSTDNNVTAVQFDCDGDLSRLWLMSGVSGEEQIQNAKTHKCLTIAGGTSTDNNVTAVQFDCDADRSLRELSRTARPA